MISYPVSFPINDAQLIINDIRNRKIVSDDVNFAKAVWELTGFALKSTLGEPAGAPLSLTMSPTTSSTIATILETIINQIAQGINFGQIASTIPWQSIAVWGLQMLLTAISGTTTTTSPSVKS